MEARKSAHESLVRHSIEKFWETIPSVWHQARAYMHKTAVERYQLTIGQFAILRGVHRGRASVSRLAEVGHISRPAISRSVDILVNRGLIMRSRDPDDRRHVKLTLTEEGERMLGVLFEEAQSWMWARIETLEDAEIEIIIDGLENLRSVFREKRYEAGEGSKTG